MSNDMAEELPNHIFTVIVASTGESYVVPPDRSILQVLREKGYVLESMCERGICARCAVRVLEGEVYHRDTVLTSRARKENRYMTICISRALGQKLVLDL
jgi:tetrachlorobenzoquinone reductase